MAQSLPDAKIVVRIDTSQAIKDAEKTGSEIQKKIDSAQKGEPSKASAPVPTQKGHSDRPEGHQADKVTKVGSAVRRVRSVASKARRSITYAGAAALTTVGIGAALSQAGRESGLPDFMVAAFDKLLQGSTFLSSKIASIESAIDAAQSSLETTKALALTQLIAGGRPDPSALAAVGKGQFQIDLAESELRRKVDQISVAAVGQGAADMLMKVVRNGLGR